jgi:DNA-binding protein HU-beta
MNRKELIDAVRRATDLPEKTVADILDETIEQIQKQVKRGERISLRGFGVFQRRQGSPRFVRNRRTGQEVAVEGVTPVFDPARRFEEFVQAQQPPKEEPPEKPKRKRSRGRKLG